MDLAFGTRVREHGYSIGRLKGVEADARTRAVRNIAIGTGASGSPVERRPLAAVPGDHFAGDIVLRALPAGAELQTPSESRMLTDATRVVRDGRQIGRLSTVEVSPETGKIVAIAGRQRWWLPRFRLQAPLDFSSPGEIRAGAPPSR